MEEIKEDEFEGYTKAAKYQLFSLFFFLGVLNHLGTILVMTGGRLLARKLEMNDYVPIYTSVSTVFSIIIRMLNSKLCLKVSYKKRVIIICFSNIFGYISMFGVLKLYEGPLNDLKELCFALSFIPCFFLGASYAFGESAMIAYLRLFPKTLIAGWTSGTGVSGCISGFLNFLTQLVSGLSLDFLYLILTPVGPLYLLLFFWTYKLLKKDVVIDIPTEALIRDDSVRKEQGETAEENNEVNNEENNEVNNEENNEINNEENVIDDDAQNNKNGPLDMDDMNKLNQTMSWNNFKVVMKMCGRTIVNLGMIYFSYFICISCLVIRDSEKIDIPFLPIETNKVVEKNSDVANNELFNMTYFDFESIIMETSNNESANNQTETETIKYEKYRKGKFEFINLFFQLGMFTAKTFIKVVRKIQPIEIYTGSILCITVLYFLEYYFGFMPYWLFPIVNYILGCFAGGTYSGAFYVILHSGKVTPEYKELTVNVATLFNDVGTFLSGIVGYLLMKYVVDSDEPHEGEEIN